MLTPRQQRAAERLLDDGGLTDNLTDDQARPLLDWASGVAAQLAAPTQRDDSEVDALLRALRKAVLQVDSMHANEHPERLVALAQGYFHEFAPGVALDEPTIIATETVSIPEPAVSQWRSVLRWLGKRSPIRSRNRYPTDT